MTFAVLVIHWSEQPCYGSPSSPLLPPRVWGRPHCWTSGTGWAAPLRRPPTSSRSRRPGAWLAASYPASWQTGDRSVPDYLPVNLKCFRLSASQTYLFLFLSCLGHGIPSLFFPFHETVFLMCVNSFVYGLFNGTFHTSANVLLLDIWRGRKSSPYMYTMHLFFGLGSFLTPLITEMFQNSENVSNKHLVSNSSVTTFQIPKEDTFWNVNNLYLIIGSLLCMSSFGFLYYYFVDKKFEYKSLAKEEDPNFILLTPVEEEETFIASDEEIVYSSSKSSPFKLTERKRLIFILLMTSFNFFFAGVEGSFKNFIPAFGSHCRLHLSRQEGSNLSGIFFGTYTANRILLIVGSMYASATVDMWFSLLLCTVSCFVLHIWGTSTKLGLQIGWVLISLSY